MDGTGPLRIAICFIASTLWPFAAYAQAIPEAVLRSADVQYELGGAAQMAMVNPSSPNLTERVTPKEPFRYPYRPPSSLLQDGRSNTALGELSVFGREDREDGRDVLRLGTALTRGKTTTGLSLTYRDEQLATRSEVFVDYALTEAFTVGVSGILSNEIASEEDPVAKIGISAAYSLDDDTFLQGAFENAPDASPVFGLSVGLRF